MADNVMDKKYINEIKELEPLVYVEAFVNPKSINGKSLRAGEDVPEDTYRVKVTQEFPIITGEGTIERKKEVYNLYIGKIYKIEELSSFSGLFRDGLNDELASYVQEGVNYVCLSSVNDGRDNYYGMVFPIRSCDNVVSDYDTLVSAVDIITSLHDKMISKPVYENGKQFVKRQD